MSDEITAACQAGYDGGRTAEPNPHYQTSTLGNAYDAGRRLFCHGYTRPTRCTNGRGHSVTVWTAANRFRVRFDWTKPRIDQIKVERLPE